VRTNFQIYDGFPTLKVEQVSQGEWSRKAKVDLKHRNKNQSGTSKTQKKRNSQNPNLKDDVGLKS
jgi:hypothetical protein